MSHSKEYQHKAFISFSTKDIDVAKELHTYLETYEIPEDLNKYHPEVPQRLGKIFFYPEEKRIHHELPELLEEEIKASEFLIVICSPNAVASEIVNKEIDYFKKYWGSEKIIPYIIAGEPNSADNEAYPKTLRHNNDGTPTNPVGLVAKGEQEKEFLAIVAKLLGKNFDDLYNREEKRKIAKEKSKLKRFIFASIIFSIALMIVFISLWSTWDAQITHKIDLKEKVQLSEKIDNSIIAIEKAKHEAISIAKREAIIETLCIMKKQELLKSFRDNANQRVIIEKQLRQEPSHFVSKKVELEWLHMLNEKNAVDEWIKKAYQEYNITSKTLNPYKKSLYSEINKQHQAIQIHNGRIITTTRYKVLLKNEKIKQLQPKSLSWFEQIIQFFSTYLISSIAVLGIAVLILIAVVAS